MNNEISPDFRELLDQIVQTIIITLPSGEKLHLVNEKQLRDHIARDLEKKAFSLAITNGGLLQGKDFYDAATMVRNGLVNEA